MLVITLLLELQEADMQPAERVYRSLLASQKLSLKISGSWRENSPIHLFPSSMRRNANARPPSPSKKVVGPGGWHQWSIRPLRWDGCDVVIEPDASCPQGPEQMKPLLELQIQGVVGGQTANDPLGG